MAEPNRTEPTGTDVVENLLYASLTKLREARTEAHARGESAKSMAFIGLACSAVLDAIDHRPGGASV